MITETTKITLTFASIDGSRWVRSYKTLKGARASAVKMLGPCELGEFGGYAISSDGVVKLTATGISLKALFADPAPPPASDMTEEEEYLLAEIALYGDGRVTTRAYPPNEGERVFNSKEDDAQAEAEAAQARAVETRLDAAEQAEWDAISGTRYVDSGMPF